MYILNPSIIEAYTLPRNLFQTPSSRCAHLSILASYTSCTSLPEPFPSKTRPAGIPSHSSGTPTRLPSRPLTHLTIVGSGFSGSATSCSAEAASAVSAAGMRPRRLGACFRRSLLMVSICESHVSIDSKYIKAHPAAVCRTLDGTYLLLLIPLLAEVLSTTSHFGTAHSALLGRQVLFHLGFCSQSD